MTGRSFFLTAVADKRSIIDPGALFKHKVLTVLVAYVTGAAEVVTDDQLIADIGSFTAEAMDAEVVGIVERTSVPRVERPVPADFFGDGGRILAEIFGDILERLTLVQRLLNELPVIERQMLSVSGNHF